MNQQRRFEKEIALAGPICNLDEKFQNKLGVGGRKGNSLGSLQYCQLSMTRAWI